MVGETFGCYETQKVPYIRSYPNFPVVPLVLLYPGSHHTMCRVVVPELHENGSCHDNLNYVPTWTAVYLGLNGNLVGIECRILPTGSPRVEDFILGQI
jgi:hypothetical protein